ncbi:hypothetical protein [Methanolapillus ohkumae]|uniref:Uncharacterized protein n=1 Tax=Methanolapillus ohkumae TaxID=3028298 RepID=A0AA96V6T0_9EURY|nr:hypothetical protein MsAm2_06880 [Methanosarcinaceae archaeon Am2]
MNSKTKKIFLAISVSVLIVMALSLIAVGNMLSYDGYDKMSEAEQEEYDFQIFKETMSEIYHQDVNREDYQRIRAGTLEMEKAFESDMEKYGKASTEYGIAYSDYIFVGRVVSHNGNYQAQENEVPNPYNLFNIEIIEQLKGSTLEDKIELKQIGGYYTKEYLMNENNNVSLDLLEKYEQGYYGFLVPEDSLIEVGEVYLFVTVAQLDGRCTIGYPDGRIHFENFDEKGLESFYEVSLYKDLIKSDIKNFERIRLPANEEIKM